MTPRAEFPPPRAVPAKIENIQLQDGNLTWTYVDDEQYGHASIDQLIFTVNPDQQTSSPSSSPPFPSARQVKPFIICCLKEDPARAPFFSLHLLTTTDAVIRDELLLQVPALSPDGLPGHLQTTQNNKVDVILSTKSGTGRAQPFWAHVVRPLLLLLSRGGDSSPTTATAQQEEQEPWNVLTTEDEQSVRCYAKSLYQPGVSRRTIILISGDGGVVDLLNGYGSSIQSRTRPPVPHLLALLPLGTANALFHSLHKPLDVSPGPTPLVLALRTLFLGTPRKLPIFKALFTPGSHIVSYTPSADKSDEKKNSNNNNSNDVDDNNDTAATLTRHDTAVSVLYGAIVASYALHASIVHESDTPEYRIHGSARFSMVAQRLLQNPHPYRASLEIQPVSPAPPSLSPSRHYRRPVHHTTHGYILVSMVSNLERTFTISPATKPLDGTLHLVHFGAVDQDKIMQAMTGAYQGGRHTLLEWGDGNKVLYEEVAAVRVTTQEEDARWRKFCVDGTIVEVERGGGMVVERVEEEAVFTVLVDERVA
ncbi:hypothetical protein E4U21_007186 [Claviceps maximensis]|nr:hypothetical protein E4U21_007186 [Claviceps maximensis]